VLATTAIVGLLLALLSAATGSPWLASIAAVASSTAAMIAIVASKRIYGTTAPAAARINRTASVPDSAAATGTARPVVPAGTPEDSNAPPSPDVVAPALPIAMPDSTEPAAVLRGLLESFGRIQTTVAAHLWLFDRATNTLRLVAATGSLPPAALPVGLQDTVLGRATTEGTFVLAPLARMRGKAADPSMWRLAIPLKAGDTGGVAAVDFHSDSEPDRESVLGMAALVRGSLTAALALHVSEQEAAAARALLDTAGELARLLDPPSVLKTILSRGMTLADASTGSIMLVDPATGGLSMELSEGLPSEVAGSARLEKGEGIAGWVLATGKPLVVEDLPGRSTRMRRHGVRTALSVPIADQDGTLGVLNVGSKTFAARLSDRTLSTLETLGRLGAMALRNAQAVRSTGDLYLDTLKTLALALETKDPYAHGGTERVVECAVALGAAMGLDAAEARALEIAALLHDIGMIATGDSTGVRQRPLTTVEWGLLKMHPVIAAELLEQAPTLREVAPIVYHHHEHYDGTGYASGVAGEDIPLAARILAVADAYVAMTSDRPYRSAMSRDEALSELNKEAGAQFDPHIVEALGDLVAAESTDIPALQGVS
jgi:HD-GYP domain-containing protein (c-di-GMP phosphodiesterase class II)